MRPLLLLAALVALPAAAQPTGLSAPQLDAYETSRLQIETVTNTRYRANWRPYGYDIQDVSTTRWRGFVGTDRVSELDFYRHAGADALADRVAGKRRTGWIAIGLGAVATGVGVAIIAGAPEGDDNRFTDTQLTGLGVSLAGVSTATVGVLLLNRNHTSLREAASAAERFNRALEQTVRTRVPEN